jgi:hypothetical protein
LGTNQMAGSGWPPSEVQLVSLHPLQLACAMLAIVFTVGLFTATQWLRQQQLNSHQPRVALQVAAMPL